MNGLESCVIANWLVLEEALDPLGLLLNAAQVLVTWWLTSCSFVHAGASFVTDCFQVSIDHLVRREFRAVAG